MNGKREDWIDVLKEAATSGRNDSLPEGLWDRISAGLDAPEQKPAGRRRRLYVWAASVAAAAAVIGLGVFTMRTSVNDIQQGTGEITAVSVVSDTPKTIEEIIEDPYVEPDGQAPACDFTPSAAPAHPYVAVSENTGAGEDAPSVEREPQQEPQGADASPASGSDATVRPKQAEKQRNEENRGANALPFSDADMFRDQLRTKKSSSRKGMMALSTNGVASISNTSVMSDVSSPMASTNMAPDREGYLTMDFREKELPLNYDQYSYRHRQPLTFALTFDVDVGHNLYVGAGVSYTKLSSKVTPPDDGKEFTQTLQYVGIPVSFKWAFLDTDWFMMYAGAEAQAEFNVGAKFGSKKIDLATMQWSVHAVAGAQLNLGKHIGVYIEPKLSHYFRDTALKTVRNTKGVNFNLQLGLRLSY